jgi:hypothetical protein
MGKSLITWVMFQPRSWVSHEWPPIKNHSKIPISMAMLVTRGYFLPMNIPSIDHWNSLKKNPFWISHE